MILTCFIKGVSETEFVFFNCECVEMRTLLATSTVWCDCLHRVKAPVVLPRIAFGTVRVNDNGKNSE